MNLRTLPAIGTAFILAACGAAAAAGHSANSSAGSGGSAATVVRPASNAGLAVEAGDDVTPVNPALVKVNGHLTTSTHSNAPAAAPAAQSVNPSADRCGGGLPGSSGGAHAATTSGKQFPLPACMPQ
jgi:hypothetical protein